MKPFRFALQAVLDARVHTEDEARAALRAAGETRGATEAAVVRLRADCANARRRLAPGALAARPTLVDIEFVAEALARGRECARDASEREAAARANFATARDERRRVEALRDRARAAFDREADLRETTTIEDANGERHNAATLFAPSFHN